MAGIQLTFDDLPPEVNIHVLPPERLFEIADDRLLATLREDSRLERKSPRIQCKDLGECFSMWANTPGGGLIVLGQHDKGELLGMSSIGQEKLNNFECTGPTYCPDAMFESKRIPFEREDGSKDFVILFFVKYHPTKVVFTQDKRCFVRMGDTQRLLRDEEVRLLKQDKGEVSVERELVDIRYPNEFDTQAIRVFVESVRRKDGLEPNHTVEDILELKHLGVRKPEGFKPNLACSLLFARKPSDVAPGCFIRFLRFEGEIEGTGDKWNAVKDDFVDGTIPEQIRKCELLLNAQLRSFSKLEHGKFYTAPEYPESAWYEAIVNACVHRAYSNGLKNTNIFLKMFDDRLEIESPGPFPPFVTPENIYEVHMPRNPYLMRALWYMDFVKCAHEGTRRIRASMQEMNLPDPEFSQQEVKKALVRVTLRNNIKLRKVWFDSDVVELLGRTLAQNLTENQKRCINFVAEHQKISVSDAQRLTGLSWPAAKRMLTDLANKRIFEHEHSPKDRDPLARFVLRRQESPDPPKR